MVFETLPKGAANAVRPDVLAARLWLGSTRKLRSVVEQERQSGALILSTFDRRGGYYRPADGEQGHREIAACYHAQRAHALAVLRRLRAMRLALGIPAGQMELDLDAEAAQDE